MKIQVLLLSLLLFSTMVYVAPQLIPTSYQTLEEGTIYIRADGSMEPSTAPIYRDGDVYTLTGNISSAGDGIVIERSNMTLDGANYTLQGVSNGVGIDLSGRNNVTIQNFNIRFFIVGIYAWSSSGNLITGNEIRDSDFGIRFIGSSRSLLLDNDITHVDLDASFLGIDIQQSPNNNIIGNRISGRWGIDSPNYPFSAHNGIAISTSPSTFLSRNNITNCILALRADGSNSTVYQNNIDDNGWGMLIGSSITVANNTIRNNMEGIRFDYDSSSNTVTGNVLEENAHAISLEGWSLPSYPHRSSYNTISYNNITSNRNSSSYGGIYLNEAPYNTLIGNHIKTNSQYAVMISKSPHITFRNNTIEGSQCNLFIDVGFFTQISVSDLSMDIDESNSVDGKPIYYWVNQQRKAVPSDAGFVALINSTDITVEGVDARRNLFGIMLFHTNNSRVAGNNVTANPVGIFLKSSFNNTIRENNVENSSYSFFVRPYGIEFLTSSNNTVFRNSISANYYGIDADSNNDIYQNKITNNSIGIISWKNSIHENYIANNDYGVEGNRNQIYQNTIENNGIGISGIENKIYHNNFINNTRQVKIDLYYRFTNIWDNSYLSGGNYWSDYTGVDADNDGLGDTPYIINLYNRDNYPLMKPWAPTHDVAVTVVVPSATEVYAGQAVDLTVTVRNDGNLTETFRVMLKYQLEGIEYLIGTKKVIDLAPNSDTTLTFTWTTTDATLHTLKTEAAVPGDVNVEDNTLIGSATVKVRIMGDITDDNKVDIRDLAQAALSFGSYPSYPEWNPWADVNQDNRIDIRDLVLIAKNFGKQA